MEIRVPRMESSDDELVARYRNGEVAALEALVDRHQRALYGYLMGMTANRAEADDLFQETWLRVIHKVAAYRNDNFGGWVMRLARNLMLDRLRRRKPEVSADREDAEGHTLMQRLPATEDGPGAAVAADELGARIAAAVATLPSEQREVFMWRTQADLPFKEIARLQGVSINTALARMQYALGKLRPVLRDDYETWATAGAVEGGGS